MRLYVVEMLRWGDREAHSYVIGVFTDKEQAETAGKAMVTYRGGKYEYCITEQILNYIDPETLEV